MAARLLVAGAAASLPSYAVVSLSNEGLAVWSSSTTDPRAVQQPSSSRLAAAWYSPSSLTVNIKLTDGQAHQVGIDLPDRDGDGVRNERVDVYDAVSGTLLDSRAVSTFQNGTYLSWEVTGAVRIVITNLAGGSNAVLSGLFFGPAK